MWRVSLARASLAAGLVVMATTPFRAAARPQAPPAISVADFFDDTEVRDIRVTISSADWAALKQHYLENTYYPCTFEWNGLTIGNATLRSRGSGSRNPQKPGLRVDFNRYIASQRFLGLKYVVLDNFWQDASMMRERVTMLLYEKLGLAVPRETFVRLFINDAFAGLYAAVEPIDDVFTGRTLGSSSGYVYEYNWERPYHFEYLGPELDAYRIFDPKTRTKDPAALIWGPIERMIRAINETPDAIFEREVSAYLDLPLVVRQFAFENFMAESDGLLGDWGLNNFYVYREEGGTRFQILEWDKDNTFHAIEYPILQGLSENVLAERAMRNGFMGAYLGALEAAALEASDPGAEPANDRSVDQRRGGREEPAPALRDKWRPSWMEKEILREYRLIRAAALMDPFKPSTNAAFGAAVQGLLDFARRRPSFVLSEVARARGTNAPARR